MLDANDIQIITKLLEQSRNETHAELEKFRSEMRTEMTALLEKHREETRAELEKSRSDTHDEMTALLEKHREETRDELKKFREEMRAELEKNRIATRNDMRAIIESEVNPKLQLLAEGHEVLLERINRLEKQDELTGRVVVLEEAVKKHNKELNALKQAQ